MQHRNPGRCREQSRQMESPWYPSRLKCARRPRKRSFGCDADPGHWRAGAENGLVVMTGRCDDETRSLEAVCGDRGTASFCGCREKTCDAFGAERVSRENGSGGMFRP